MSKKGETKVKELPKEETGNVGPTEEGIPQAPGVELTPEQEEFNAKILKQVHSNMEGEQRSKEALEHVQKVLKDQGLVIVPANGQVGGLVNQLLEKAADVSAIASSIAKANRAMQVSVQKEPQRGQQ